MSELKKYWVLKQDLIDHNPCSDADAHWPAIYLAADVEQVFRPIIEDYCISIQKMLDLTSTELPAKGPARQALAEAASLLERLK